MTSTIGLIGIGGLGLPIAVNLLQAGHTVIGYRRSSMDDFIKAGGTAGTSPADVAGRSDLVLTCLRGDGALHDVISGPDGVIAAGHAGLAVFDLSTLPLAAKRREAQALAAAGMEMLDCTISGNPRYIEAKTAAIFVGGGKAAFTRHRAVLDAITGNVTHVGGFGAGRMAKFIAFYLVIAHTQAAAEAFTLATKAGLDPKDMFDAIAGSQASSAMLETRGKLMVERDYSSYPGKLPARARSFEHLAKLAQALGGDYPMLEAINQTLGDAEAAGFTEHDVSSVFEYLLEKAGAEPADGAASFAFLDDDMG